MIKTHTDEMIDPRVGDVVRSDGMPDVIEIKDFVIAAEKYGFIFGDDSLGGINPEFCTLMHRPFEVGDEIEVADIGFMNSYWDDAIFSLFHQGRIESTDTYKGRFYSELYRHKDPALHDHPTYQQEKAA